MDEKIGWGVYALYSLIAAILLLIAGGAAASGAKTRTPGKLQTAFEVMLDGLRGVFADAIGPGGVQYLPIVLTLFLYILFCNLLGLVPFFRSATSNAGTTIGLGLFVFVFIQYVGIKHNGLGGYLKHFLGPVLALAPLLFIIEIVGEIAKPFSLGMRLYGNIYGEDIINGLLTNLGNGLFHIPLQVPVYFLQLFTSVIQAFIFAMLTCAYINTFTSHSHDEHGHGEEHIELPA
jgi:F-type H+-transporting ATPase subunit a